MLTRRVAGLALYSTSCWCMHNLLLAHYYSSCRTSFLTFVLPESPYCSFVHGAVQLLQCSPLLVAAPMLLSHKIGANYFVDRDQDRLDDTSPCPPNEKNT